jgi:hypothetical protein
LEILDRQWIWYVIGIESSSLIRNDHEEFPTRFPTTMNMNQLASIQAIAVKHRVTQGFPKSEFNVLLLATDTTRCRD